MSRTTRRSLPATPVARLRHSCLVLLAAIAASCGGEDGGPNADAGPDLPDVPPTDVADSPDVADAPLADDALDAPDSPDASPPPLYRVEDGRIVDRLGRTLILRGINVASGDLVKWAGDPPDVEEHVFRHVADSGFNAVRFVINWDRIEPRENEFQQDYLDIVERQVRKAAAEGLYVVLDMHQDMYGVGFGLNGAPAWTCDPANYDAFQPIEPWFFNYYSGPVSACFDHFWKTHEVHAHQQESARRVAERVADVDLVVGFDPHNEPFPGTIDPDEFDAQYLYPFYEEFAATVGSALPGRLYFIEPAVTFSASLSCLMPGPITAFQAVFAPHYYNTTVEMQKSWDGDGGANETAVQTAQDVAGGLHAALAYGEMGGARETTNLGDYLVDLFEELDARRAGSFLWIYSRGTSGFGMIEEATGEWTSHSWSYLRPAPTRVGGVPTAYSWTPATGTMVLEWQDAGTQPTEVMLPKWIRDAGYACTLDGAPATPELDATFRHLVIRAGPPGPRSFHMVVAAAAPR